MDIDFNTAAWKQVEDWAKAELAKARTKNDGELDPVQTASVRGEIRFIKKLLDLPHADARARGTDLAIGPLGG